MDDHNGSADRHTCCREIDAFEHFIGGAREHIPLTSFSADDVGVLLREIGREPSMIHAAVVAARTRTLRELVALLGWAAHRPTHGADLVELGPIEAIIGLAREHMQSAPDALQRAWTVLSVLEHPVPRNLAERVLGAGGVQDPEGALAALVSAGVLARREEDGDLMFRMRAAYLVPGKEALDRGPELREAARQGLLDWWWRTAQDFRASWFGGGQVELFDRIDSELPSLELLLETTHAGDGGRLAEVVALLWPLWTARGRVEAPGWLDHARAAGRPDPDVHFQAQWASAWLALAGSDVDAADRALAAARPVTSRHETQLRQIGGIRALYVGDAPAATAALTEALESDLEHGSPSDVFIDLSYLAATAWYVGDHASASAHCARAEELSDRHGEGWIRFYAVWVSALVAWRTGDHDRAHERALECARSASTHGDRHAAALALEILSWHQADAGHPRRAARLLGVVHALETVVGVPTLFWSTETPHQEAVDSIVAQIGRREYEQIVRAAGLHGVTDAVAWLEEASQSAEPSGRPGKLTMLLTPRQLEVATLVADGLTNKQIARRLMITVRAVEAHVERIFTRLGYVSRAQVAAWVARRAGGAE